LSAVDHVGEEKEERISEEVQVQQVLEILDQPIASVENENQS
jgi:hypothetical protein